MNFKMKELQPSVTFLLGLILLFTSCTAYHTSTGNMNMPAPTEKSKIVGTAIGTAKAMYFFGIGGMAKDGLLLEAKKDMQGAYPLLSGQVYTNTTIDTKRAYYLVYSYVKVTLSADILDYQPDTQSSANKTEPLPKSMLLPDGISKVSEGDIVFFEGLDYSAKEAKVTKIREGKYPKIGWMQGKRYRSRLKSPYALVPLKPTDGCDVHAKHKIGETVNFYRHVSSDKKILTEGKITNVMGKLYLIEFENKGQKDYQVKFEGYLRSDSKK